MFIHHIRVTVFMAILEEMELRMVFFLLQRQYAMEEGEDLEAYRDPRAETEALTMAGLADQAPMGHQAADMAAEAEEEAVIMNHLEEEVGMVDVELKDVSLSVCT